VAAVPQNGLLFKAVTKKVAEVPADEQETQAVTKNQKGRKKQKHVRRPLKGAARGAKRRQKKLMELKAVDVVVNSFYLSQTTLECLWYGSHLSCVVNEACWSLYWGCFNRRPVPMDAETGMPSEEDHITNPMRRGPLLKELFSADDSVGRLRVHDASHNPECIDARRWEFACKRVVYRGQHPIVVTVRPNPRTPRLVV